MGGGGRIRSGNWEKTDKSPTAGERVPQRETLPAEGGGGREKRKRERIYLKDINKSNEKMFTGELQTMLR